MSDVVAVVVERIYLKLDPEAKWQISIEELIEMTGMRREDLYRRLYARRDDVETICPDVFSEENLWDLFFLLGNGETSIVEDRFAAAGLYLPHPTRIEIQDGFIVQVSRKIRESEVDTEAFQGMLRVERKVDSAIALYLRHFFNIEELIESFTHHYVSTGKYPDSRVARIFIRGYLRLLFERNIVTPEIVFGHLVEQLVRMAEAAGYKTTSSESERPKEKTENALSVLGLDHMPGDIEELRSHYRILMKTYHPDLNPRGLEMSKRITAAYSYLLGEG